MIPPVVVAGLHLRWDGVRQRPQHLLSRLARRTRVIVVEEPLQADADRDAVMQADGLTVVRPLRRRGWGPPLLDDATIETVRELAVEQRAGVWLYTPMMRALVDVFAGTPFVYEVMDELAQFAFAPAGMAENDAWALARADLVVTGGRSLYARRAHAGAKVRCEPSGVELERFAADVAPHPMPAALRGPVFGYTGVIDERLDMGLITALADACTDAHIVLVGPVVKIDPADIPRRANLHLTGPVPYDALPSWLAAFDVALMPFARNAATEFISPTKMLEYMAARVPVVSTPIADVVAEAADAAFIADHTDAFVHACRTALQRDETRLARGFALAQSRTWDAIAARIIDAVDAT